MKEEDDGSWQTGSTQKLNSFPTHSLAPFGC